MTRPESSSFPVLWIAGLVGGVLLILLLLLLLLVCLYHRYTKSKGEIYLSRMYVATAVQLQIQRHVTAAVFFVFPYRIIFHQVDTTLSSLILNMTAVRNMLLIK